MQLWLERHAQLNPEVITNVKVFNSDNSFSATYALVKGTQEGRVGAIIGITLYGDYGRAITNRYLRDKDMRTVTVPTDIIQRLRRSENCSQ